MSADEGAPQFNPPDDGCEETTLRRLAAWAHEMSAWGARTIAPAVVHAGLEVDALKRWREAQEAEAAYSKGRRAAFVVLLVFVGSLLSEALSGLLHNVFSQGG